jgi:hypothetical protein
LFANANQKPSPSLRVTEGKSNLCKSLKERPAHAIAKELPNNQLSSKEDSRNTTSKERKAAKSKGKSFSGSCQTLAILAPPSFKQGAL